MMRVSTRLSWQWMASGWMRPGRRPLDSEVSQPSFDFAVRHHVVGGEPTFPGKKYDLPVQPGPALEQFLPQPPGTDTGVQVRTTEAVAQRPQGFRNLLPVGGAQRLHPLLQAGVEIDSHSLPVNAVV